MSSMGTVYFVVFVGFLLTELHAFQPFTFPSKQQPFSQRPELTGGPGTTQGQTKAAEEEREQIKSVTVSCHPGSLVIVIQADLFGVGASVKSSDLRLGVDKDEHCRATAFSRDEYRITLGLLDCGTKHWMTEDSLVYTNLLIYSPEPSADGVIRMEDAVIPIECHYERKYSLSSSAVSPTWIPFVSTVTALEKLNFALKVMTPDWLYKRSSNVFYLGEPINIEASVRLGLHSGLRVFLNSCVATVAPDAHSLPRYVFIEDGCLLDSQVPSSRSQFLSRVQDDKLYLVIDAFRFHNENRGELYITCHMNAVPVNDAEAPNKACTFVNGRWRSADGNDYLCGYCQTQNEEGHIQDKTSSQFSPLGFGRPAKSEAFWRNKLKTDQEWDKEAKLGPLLVLPTEKKTEQHNAVFPQKVNEAVYGSAWRSGVHKETGSVVDGDDNVVSELEGFVPDLSSTSEEEAAENSTSEAEEYFPSNVTDSNEEDADGNYTDTENGPDEFSEKLEPQVFREILENETTTTTNVSDVNVTLSNVLVISSNATDSNLTDTKELKR